MNHMSFVAGLAQRLREFAIGDSCTQTIAECQSRWKIKPRIRLGSSVRMPAEMGGRVFEQWECRSPGVVAFGLTPVDAFRAWQSRRGIARLGMTGFFESLPR